MTVSRLGLHPVTHIRCGVKDHPTPTYVSDMTWAATSTTGGTRYLKMAIGSTMS
jgi:hypothetical protein